MRLLYKPFAIIGAIIAGRIGRKAFDSIWTQIDDAPPPRPGTGQGTAVKVIYAQALRAGVMAASAAAVDRVFARGFHYAIGIWPKKPPKPKDDKQQS
jgi:hypothetical protein